MAFLIRSNERTGKSGEEWQPVAERRNKNPPGSKNPARKGGFFTSDSRPIEMTG